jgi:hypothetical protein
MSDDPDLMPEPWLVSDRVQHISITGNLIPWREGKPEYVMMHGSEDLFLPTYTTTERLYEHHLDDGNLTVKTICDSEEFLANLPYWYEPGVSRLRVIVDMHRTPRKTMAFKEVYRVPPTN